jgi:protein-tyrosine phosphatase
MFLFKKNTPLLKTVIPSNYIDIHSHLLPNIDDGATDIDNSLALISGLKQIGISKIITTPHIIKDVWNNNRENIIEKHQETAAVLLEKQQTIPFNVAAEYMLDGYFFDLIKNNEKLLTLKDNFVLVEMSYLYPPLQLYDMLFELQVAGYKPVLAHPERYNSYHFATEEFKKLKKAGCLFQINLLSAVGYYGPNVTKTADFLLKNNLIDFAGTDVHHQKHLSFFDKKIIIKNVETLSKIMENNSNFDF